MKSYSGLGSRRRKSSGGYTVCPTSDQSFYCKMSRSLGIFRMIILFIIYYIYSNRKSFFK